MVSELDVTRAVIQTDNQGVARALCSEQLDQSRFGSLSHEIKDLMAHVGDFRVTWTRREANQVAHILAREGGLFSLLAKGLVRCNG